MMASLITFSAGLVLLIIWCAFRKQSKNKTIPKSNPSKTTPSYEIVENEDWVTYDSADRLVDSIYKDQLEGAQDNKSHQAEEQWRSGKWSGTFENRSGEILNIPEFTLTFCFETDTVIGYGQEESGEFLVTGFFSPFSNRLAFKHEFMDTPGRDESNTKRIHCPVNFQLKWEKKQKLFVGNFYLIMEGFQSDGFVVLSRCSD